MVVILFLVVVLLAALLFALYGAISLALGHLLLRCTLGKSLAEDHLWISRILLLAWVVGTAYAYTELVEQDSTRAPVVIVCWIFGAWIAEWRRLTATWRIYMRELQNRENDSPKPPLY